MCTHQFVFRINLIDPFVPYIIGNRFGLIQTAQLAEFLDIIVHLLIRYYGQCLIILKRNPVVFIEYCLTVFIQVDCKAVRCFYRCNMKRPVFDIKPFQIIDIRITQRSETAKAENIPNPIQIFLTLRYRKVVNGHQFIPSEVNDTFLGRFQFGLKGEVSHILVVTIVRRPFQKPF